jgi:lipooligosaccharide transport system ATP-binding protein
MEIYGASKERMGEFPFIDRAEIRCESYQDTMFIYSDDPEKLSGFAEALHISNYHVRQANLEDLFLKVTGRGLNELQ